MRTPDQRLTAMAANQLALFTRADARAAGLSDKQLHARVVNGHYELLGNAVFAVAGTPWTWERRALAGLLAVGPSGWLSHRAAAHLLGFDGFHECPIEITVPRGSRRRTDLAVVHATRRLAQIDRFRLGRFPVTSGARTIVDLCAAGVSEDEAAAAIGSAIRDGYTSIVFLRKRLAALRGRGRSGVRFLDKVLAGPIAHSHLERAFLKLVRDNGIDEPETQVVFDGDGVIRVDVLWRPERVIAEVMGHRFHVTREQQQRDARRRGELQEIDHRVLEFTTLDVARRPAYCVATVRRNLAARRPSAA